MLSDLETSALLLLHGLVSLLAGLISTLLMSPQYRSSAGAPARRWRRHFLGVVSPEPAPVRFRGARQWRDSSSKRPQERALTPAAGASGPGGSPCRDRAGPEPVALAGRGL